jgi:hypothetical protein
MKKLLSVFGAAFAPVAGAFALVFGLAGSAFAADTGITGAAASAASSFSSNGNTALASIGGAIIGLAGVAVLYKWVKAMFFS